MTQLDKHMLADTTFQLEWNSHDVHHVDRYHAKGLNLWRDYLPEAFGRALVNTVPGDRVAMSFAPREIFKDYADNTSQQIWIHQFDPRRIGLEGIVPRRGRFYPKGLLSDINGVFRANREPFRCVKVENDHLKVDLGHPLGDYGLTVSAAVENVYPKQRERGGSSQQWLSLAAEGPGMQAGKEQTATDFFSDHPFQRDDDKPDAKFYHQPRFVAHIDVTAGKVIRDLYSVLLQDRKKCWI